MSRLISSNLEPQTGVIYGDQQFGMAFTLLEATKITQAEFGLNRNGQTGTLYVKIYNITGTIGVDAKPTGTALATSDGIDLATARAVVPAVIHTFFNFSGINQIILPAGDYIITTESTNSNYMLDESDNSSTGYLSYADGGAWTSYPGKIQFGLHGEPVGITDTYNESHSNQDFLQLQNFGQSFSCTVDSRIESSKFYVQKQVGATGSVVSKLYTVSGTSGVDAVPGVLLATSETINFSDISTSQSLLTFSFSGLNKVTMRSGQSYVITIESTPTNSYLSIYSDLEVDPVFPSHPGNASANIGSWAPLVAGVLGGGNNVDMVFYVYGLTFPVGALPTFIQ